MNPGRPARSLVFVLTELPGFLYGCTLFSKTAKFTSHGMKSPKLNDIPHNSIRSGERQDKSKGKGKVVLVLN
jgi:hypothetical protein